MTPPRWLPNAISTLRLILVPIWVVVAELHQRAFALDATDRRLRWVCFAILVTIGLSDILDGWLARRFSLATRVGATLDAVADKLAQVTLFTWLALRGAPAFDPIPLWFIGVLIARDGVLSIGYLVVRLRRGEVATEHRAHGKIASFLMFLLLVWVLWGAGLAGLPWALGALAGLLMISTLLYIRDGLEQLAGRSDKER